MFLFLFLFLVRFSLTVFVGLYILPYRSPPGVHLMHGLSFRPALVATFSLITISMPYCCTAVLSYHRTHIAGSWVGVACLFFAVCCAVLLLYCVLLCYCCCTGWLDGSVRECVHGFVFFFVFCLLFSRYTGPAVP